MSSYLIPFLVITYTLLAMIIVVLILGKKGKEEDASIKRKKNIGKETVKVSYKNVDSSFYDRVVKPIVDKLNNSEKYGENATKTERQKKENELLSLQLRKAGMHISPTNFRFFKLAFSAVMIVVSIGLSAILYFATESVYMFAVAGVGVIVGLVGPNFFLTSRVRSHQNAIKSQLAETIDSVKQYTNPNIRIDGILLTRYTDRTILNRDMAENIKQLAERLKTKVFKTTIREAVNVREAQLSQKSIFTFAPKAKVTQDYANFIAELLEGE